MSDEQEKSDTGAPAEAGRKGGSVYDQEPAGEEFGESFTTNSGLGKSTGVGRKDTPDATVSKQGITGGPETGTTQTTKL